MAQMLLETPIHEAHRRGYVTEGYFDLEERLHEIKDQIRSEMRDIVNQHEKDPKLKDMILNSIPTEGSYHRGALISITSSSNGHSRDIHLSAAGELFYWATAWLDDIADENSFRQSTKALRMQTNDNIAMYVSNSVYGIIMEAIIKQYELEPVKLAKILKYFAQNFHVINRGQAKDIFLAEKPLRQVNTSEYLQLIEETTGVDVATNLAIGSISAGLNDETLQNIYQFGLRLGTLAQIRDDVLDYCDLKDSNGQYIIGKMPFRDVQSKKKRLPVLLTKNSQLRHISPEIYDKIEIEFIQPRINQARTYLNSTAINEDSKELLNKILNYWSDIRIFQKILT